jgi:4-hydroxy-2-oxoheptanedioate aldolase
LKEGRVSFSNPLRAAWAAGRSTYGGWVSTADPLAAEYQAAAGFDEIMADMQHGAIAIRDLPALFGAIERHGVAPTARVPELGQHAISTALDMGALAVIVPMVETVAETEALVAACRYPPVGRRSAGPTRSIYRAGLLLDALADVAAVAMVETVRGLENVEAIAAVPGLDAIYVGPGDLAISLGIPVVGTDRSEAEQALHRAALERIVAACRAAGIVAGIYAGTGARARDYAGRGFRMLTVAWDAGLLEDGARAELAVARGE